MIARRLSLTISVPCSLFLGHSFFCRLNPGKVKLSAACWPSAQFIPLNVGSCMAVLILEALWTLNRSLPPLRYTHRHQVLCGLLYLIFCWLSLLQPHCKNIFADIPLVKPFRFALLSVRAHPTGDAYHTSLHKSFIHSDPSIFPVRAEVSQSCGSYARGPLQHAVYTPYESAGHSPRHRCLHHFVPLGASFPATFTVRHCFREEIC